MKSRLTVLLTALVSVLLSGCASTVTTGPFTQLPRIETELKRGVSTKADVQRVLGDPKGTGNAVLPVDPRSREVWYYADIEGTRAAIERAGLVRLELREQMLLVFFQGEIFDGFLWFSNVGPARTR